MRGLDAVEWASILCGHRIQNDWASRAMNLHPILHCLDIPPWKLFRWFRRLQLRATGDWQLHHDNVPAHTSCLAQSFLAKHQIIQVIQPPYSPDLVLCNFWLFPKLKSPLKGKRLPSDCRWDSGKHNGAAYSDWENYVRSQGADFEGDWNVIVLCTMFLVSCIFFNKCLYFS